MKTLFKSLFWLASMVCLGSAIGCAPMAASARDEIPMENLKNCRALCKSVDMKLGALVVVANYSGCVCEPKGDATQKKGSIAAAAGGSLVQMIARQKYQRLRRNGR